MAIWGEIFILIKMGQVLCTRTAYVTRLSAVLFINETMIHKKYHLKANNCQKKKKRYDLLHVLQLNLHISFQYYTSKCLVSM